MSALESFGTRAFAPLAAAVLCLLACHDLTAGDHILVIGGGPDAFQSQVSLEENVLYLQRILPRIGWDGASLHLLFASGSGTLPDVCIANTAGDSDLRVTLAGLFGQTSGIDLAFRHNRLHPHGPATRAAVFERLGSLATQLQNGDRLLIYVTGHGGKGTPQTNGYFYTWNRERVHVREFAEILDRFDPQVQVLVVMVQCYSGSFANLIFNGGERNNGVCEHQRAGFFATVASRPASGCTTEMPATGLQEYSTYFWQALSGSDRQGNATETADWDNDGTVTALEAHAQTILTAPTIDVSLRTSDWFLRTHAPQDRRDGRLLQFDRDYSRLLAVAEFAEKEILSQLSVQLSLGGENRIAEAGRQLEQVEYEHLGNQEEITRLETRRDTLRTIIGQELLKRWPTLKNPWHPHNQAILTDDQDAVWEAIRSHTDWPRLQELESKIEEIEAADHQNQLLQSKLQRLIHTAESVALAQNLQTAGSKEHWNHYQQLLRLEKEFLQVPLAAHTSN